MNLRRFCIGLFIIPIGTVLYDCSASLPLPEASHLSQLSEGDSKSSVESLLKGRELYIQHCSSCHRLYEPKSRTTNQWRDILDEMALKTKMRRGDEEVVLEYLSFYSESKQLQR